MVRRFAAFFVATLAPDLFAHAKNYDCRRARAWTIFPPIQICRRCSSRRFHCAQPARIKRRWRKSKRPSRPLQLQFSFREKLRSRSMALRRRRFSKYRRTISVKASCEFSRVNCRSKSKSLVILLKAYRRRSPNSDNLFRVIALFHKRQFHNFRRTFARRRSQCQFVPCLIRFAADIAERDIRIERRRFHRAGHMAGFLAVEK